MNKMKDVRIAVIGLGYVGLPLAVEFGKKVSTVGFDLKQDRIGEIISGRDPTREATPEDLASARLLSFSTDSAAIADCNCFIITVPTPIDEHKRPDLSALLKASATAGKALK